MYNFYEMTHVHAIMRVLKWPYKTNQCKKTVQRLEKCLKKCLKNTVKHYSHRIGFIIM